MQLRQTIRTSLTMLISLIALSLLVGGCSGPGGGGTGTDAGSESATIAFNEDLSGYILLSTTGNPFVKPTKDGESSEVLFIAAGDGFSGQVERGFLTFNLDLPPETVEVVSAELHVYLQHVANDPYAELGGELNAHSVDYGGSLDMNDYYAVKDDGPFSLSSDVSDEDSWISADVTTAVADDWNDGENYTQFLLRFPIDNNSDTSPQGVDIEGDGSSADAPYLVIHYR